MKQILEYIESNKKLMQELIEEFEATNPDDKMELRRLDKKITQFDYYIRGLEDAKKYIEEESKEV